MTTYIVVADAARARIFTRDALKLVEQDSLVHAASRLHEGDLVTGRGGEVHESTANTVRAASGEDRAHAHEEQVFAKEVAEHVYQARVANHLDKLILVAPPRFLGKLRDKLDGPTTKHIIHSLPKDLSKASLEDIQAATRDLR